MKNISRIASILGPWVGQTKVQSVGQGHSNEESSTPPYQISAYLSMYFMPDPMRAYSCDNHCAELNNRACVLGTKVDDFRCVDLEREVLDWSDGMYDVHNIKVWYMLSFNQYL